MTASISESQKKEDLPLSQKPQLDSSVGKGETLKSEKKEKRRGVTDILKAQRPPQFLTPSQSPIFEEKDPTIPIRDRALERLRILRSQYPIKTKVIDAELREAERFLNGRIEPAGKNEFSLVWRIEGTEFAMNFETPHGTDSTIYKGNRRDRVLSILETCYLIGLNEDKINKFIEDHNLHHLERVSKFMVFIFFNPNR